MYICIAYWLCASSLPGPSAHSRARAKSRARSRDAGHRSDVCIYVCVCVYIYIYIERERDLYHIVHYITLYYMIGHVWLRDGLLARLRMLAWTGGHLFTRIRGLQDREYRIAMRPFKTNFLSGLLR